MYHVHWGLTHAPFGDQGTTQLYAGESQVEARARLRYAADQRRHALLLGECGAGKTRTLQCFAQERRAEGGQAAYLNFVGLSARDLLWQIAGGLSLAPRPEDDVLRLYRRLGDYAATAQWRPTAPVLLMDDVDQAGPDAQTQLARLLSLGPSGSWGTIVLAALPGRSHRISDKLRESIDLQIELEPWTEADVAGYLQHRLLGAGCDRPVFDDEAFSVIYAVTGGTPRSVNRLAEHALLGAAAAGLDRVDAAIVEAAYESLGWTALGPA
jgi:general secretion pathway protein A